METLALSSGYGKRGRKVLRRSFREGHRTLSLNTSLTFLYAVSALCCTSRVPQNADNPAVQLQGPFFVKELVPPPAYRNVVMIAAGTGINPSSCSKYLTQRDAKRRKKPALDRVASLFQPLSSLWLTAAGDVPPVRAVPQPSPTLCYVVLCIQN